jgi:hypothetical protein
MVEEKNGGDVDLDKKQIKEQQKAAKQAEKAKKKADREAKEAADRKMAGREIASESMWSMGQVKIYENGYVVFDGGFGSPVFEKLKSFEVFDNNLTKKSGLGRGAGAVLTLGLNLWSPNTRGNLILTIVTDKKTHTAELLPQVNVIKSVNRLQAAANAVLNSKTQAVSSAGSSKDNVSDSLEKLVSLRDAGALSNAEFEKAKAKLLGM